MFTKKKNKEIIIKTFSQKDLDELIEILKFIETIKNEGVDEDENF